MKNSEEAVDRLLAGLRDAEPAAGFEARLLTAMERATPARSRWFLHAAVAAGIGIAAAWCIATIKVPQEPAMPMYQPSLAAAELPAKWEATPSKGHRVREAKHLPTDPAQLASFPTPPLPLTQQEKLLLRLAHQQDVSNVAALNPAVHAAQMAKANEQFQQFFEIEAKEMRRLGE